MSIYHIACKNQTHHQSSSNPALENVSAPRAIGMAIGIAIALAIGAAATSVGVSRLPQLDPRII